MNDEVKLQALSAGQVQTFRYQVLRPHEEKHSVYALDDATTTLHAGAFIDGSLASVATICREPLPGSKDASEWRLRGMATVDRYRGRGLGKRLAEFCVAHALSEGGSRVWCSARVSAIGFYRSLGFEEQTVKSFSLPEYSREQYVLMIYSILSQKT